MLLKGGMVQPACWVALKYMESLNGSLEQKLLSVENFDRLREAQTSGSLICALLPSYRLSRWRVLMIWSARRCRCARSTTGS